MPGYDTGRFLNTPANEFVCLICYDVLHQPVIVPECEHVFCQDCLIDWLACKKPNAENENNNNNNDSTTNTAIYSGRCPIDRTVVHTNELRPPQRVFRNLLSALQIRCSFAPDCDVFIPICELEYHENNCPHNPLNAHRSIDCPKNCGANIRITLASEHKCVEYLKERLELCEKQRDNNHKQIEELIQEKQSLIETIQNDTNRYESTIQKLRADCDKMKKSYEKELNKLRSSINSNYSQLARRVGNGTNSLHLPSGHKSQSINTLNNTGTSNSFDVPSGSGIVRKSSLDGNLSPISDAFSLELMPLELPPPLTPSKVSSPQTKDQVNNFSKFYNDSFPNLSTNSETNSQSESPISSPSPSTGSVVGKAVRMFNRLPTMIPYVNPPAQLNNSSSTLATLDLTEHIRRHCQNEKIVQVMSLVDRRHFYPSNEYYKCLSIKHGAHSFKLAHELKLLEVIEPLINGESRILDIGSGHGFLTVCLAQIARHVLGVEHIKELHGKSREIVHKHYAHLYESNRIDFLRQDGRLKCWSGKFDLILVEAIVKHELPAVYLRSLRSKGSVIAVIRNNSRLQLCRVQTDSSERSITQVLNNDHEYLSQQYKDVLCDIRSQETTFLNRFKQF